MPELRLLPLEETLGAELMGELARELAELGVESLDDDSDDVDLEDVLSEDQLTDFMDRLEAHDIACTTYLPLEFEGRIELGDQGEHVIGSAHMLMEALEELRDELDIDDEGDPEDDEDLELEMIEEQLGYAWRVFARATSACIARSVPLHVIE